jgi:hypothetical protein
VPSSSAIRSATLRAAIRRGWVWPISPSRRPTPRPSSRQILGSWVVLPEPGLAGDDDDLVVADRGGDVVAADSSSSERVGEQPHAEVEQLARGAVRASAGRGIRSCGAPY